MPMGDRVEEETNSHERASGGDFAESDSRAPLPPVRITALAAGGDGVGRLDDGRVVFVEGGVPGDLVEPKDWTERKRMVRARIARLIEASPDRVEPPCAHFGVCGGCLWQHIDYPAQLVAKLEIVRSALERIAGLDADALVEIVPSPRLYAYRARARLVEGAGRVGYRRRGSREVEAIEACPVLLPAVEARRVELSVERALVHAGGSRSGSEAGSSKRRGRAREVEWELLAGTGDSVACGRVGEWAGAGERVELSVLGETLQASRASFVQGNAWLWDELAEEVRSQVLEADGSESGPPGRFVELYAGIGFLTLPLVRRGLEGIVIESSKTALLDLRSNLRRAGLDDRVEIVAGRVEKRGDLEARFARAEVLIVDPPRRGLEESIRKAVARAGPQRIVYVSCDPATLARDLRLLVEEGGYRMASVRAFDLFPQTPHVEVVTRLERVQGSSKP